MEYGLRDYVEEPLSESEIRALLGTLGMRPGEALRKRDPAWRELDLDEDDDDAVIAAMARHPGLLERPIAVRGDRAVVARPPERVKELL